MVLVWLLRVLGKFEFAKHDFHIGIVLEMERDWKLIFYFFYPEDHEVEIPWFKIDRLTRLNGDAFDAAHTERVALVHALMDFDRARQARASADQHSMPVGVIAYCEVSGGGIAHR